MAESKLELPGDVPVLNTYYVYLTGGCNLACQHCYLAPKYQADGGTGGHLDYDLFAIAIEEGMPLGLSNVKLTGGEPLLHPDFIRIIDLLYAKGLGLTMETNGVLMTEGLAHYLREKSTLSHVSISLDGASADTHDPFRGVKGSFDKAIQGIRQLVKAGFQPQVIMSLHVGNVDEIEALVQLAVDNGAGSVKFNLIQSSGRGEVMEKRGRTLSIHRLIEIGKWIEKDVQKRSPISLHYSWPMAFYTLNRLQSNGSASCGIFNILGILSTGHLAMCGVGMLVDELCYGLLGKDSVADVWSSHPFLLEMRKSFPSNLEGICRNCVFRDSCLASCVANNFLHSSSMNSSFWFCQTATDNGLFPLSRLKYPD